MHLQVGDIQKTSQTNDDPEVMTRFGRAAIRSGLVALLLRVAAAFSKVPAESCSRASGMVALACVPLQMISMGDGCARRIVAGAESPVALHTTLMAAVEHGGIAARGCNFYKLENYAAMCLCVLFGGQESDDSDSELCTVPRRVLVSLVEQFLAVMKGTNGANPVNMACCMLAASVSDANTAELVGGLKKGEVETAEEQWSKSDSDFIAPVASELEGGLLDGITMALTQGDAELADRQIWFKYDITRTREVCSAILLNLALSVKTVDAVAGHSALLQAVEHALSDGPHLTHRMNKKLQDVQLALEMHSEAGQAAAKDRVQAAAENSGSRHVMLSYAWAQQELVLRLRRELGRRNYSIWIDVEQMQGSTVDSMADAIDAAYSVVYCMTQAYKESANCKLEAMYAHQSGVQMIPVMLEDNWQPNGWLGMLLGTRLWYGFIGSVVEDDKKFKAKMDELCRELGPTELGTPRHLARGAPTSLATPSPAPAPTPAAAPSPAPAPTPAPAPPPPAAPAAAEAAAAREARVSSLAAAQSGVPASYAASTCGAAAAAAAGVTARVAALSSAGLVSEDDSADVVDEISDMVDDVSDAAESLRAALAKLERLGELSAALPDDKQFARQIVRKTKPR